MSVLDYYLSTFKNINVSIKAKNLSALNSVELYIIKFGELFNNYPAMISILNSYEVLSHEQEIANQISDIVLLGLTFLTQLYQEAIDSSELDGKVSAESLAYITTGTISSITLAWKLQNYNFSLTDKIKLITDEMKTRILI